MKKFSLKLIGILFVTIFCLAPLCAAEFNSETDEANANIIAEENGIEIREIENTSEISDEKLGRDYFDKLYIHVDDVVKGEPIVMDVSTADFISCGVYVMFKGLNFLWLDNGHGQLTFDSSDLNPGTYEVTVQSQTYEDPSFVLEPASTTFKVLPN